MSDPCKILPLEDYLKLDRDPHQWVIQDIIPTRGLVNLYSSPKVGKTMLTMHLALAIADPSISSYIGFPVVTHGPVAFLELDTPRNQWAFRLERATKDRNLPKKTLFVADRLTVPKNFSITSRESKDWLAEQIAHINPVCVFIDTLREFHDGDEDSANDMKRVISSVLEAIPHSAIVFLSHSRKSLQSMVEEIGNIIDDARGSSYIAGKMDSIIKLTKKVLAYQTRAGKGDFPIHQLPQTGELRRFLNDKTLTEYIRTLRERNPEMPVDQHITIISETADISKDLALQKYNLVLQERADIPADSPELDQNTKNALKALKDLPND